MGCAVKNAKVIAIALSSLKRLIALRAVTLSQAAIPAITQTNEQLHVARSRHTVQEPPDYPLPHHQWNFPTVRGKLHVL
jgi:hypothetical protein